MKVNKLLVVVLAGLVSTQAFAINHMHRQKLAKAHCTQAAEAQGLCDSKAMRKVESDDNALRKAREWDNQHAGNEANDDKDVRLFCKDLPVDATNWQMKTCVK